MSVVWVTRWHQMRQNAYYINVVLFYSKYDHFQLILEYTIPPYY